MPRYPMQFLTTPLVVTQNAVQVTVAGVMATWCFVEQEAQSCCSPGVYSSVYRSLTYSFGSICMGSLLEAFVTALRVMIQSARNQSNERDDGGCGAIVLCLLECIAKCLENVLEYFNQWVRTGYILLLFVVDRNAAPIFISSITHHCVAASSF